MIRQILQNIIILLNKNFSFFANFPYTNWPDDEKCWFKAFISFFSNIFHIFLVDWLLFDEFSINTKNHVRNKCITNKRSKSKY